MRACGYEEKRCLKSDQQFYNQPYYCNSSSSIKPPRQSAMSFPNKEDRKKCWDSRDRYWECLDKHDDDQTKCGDCKAKYEVACPSQWVKHFDRKRNYLKFKDKIESEGYEPIDDPNSDKFKSNKRTSAGSFSRPP